MSDITITDTQKPNKDKLGRFVKGHKTRGNPGGRPKSEHWLNQRIDEDLPAYYDRMKHIALHGHEAHSLQVINHFFNRRFGKPKAAVQIDTNITRHFVLRAPTVMESAEAFELKYGFPDNPDTVDVTPAKPETRGLG